MNNNRAIPFIVGTLVCLIVWAALAQLVMGDSKQRCTASDEICAWELR